MKKLTLIITTLASVAAFSPTAANANPTSGTAVLEHGKCRVFGIEYTCPRYERRLKKVDIYIDQGRPNNDGAARGSRRNG